jgi:hypothetical protein
MRRGCSQPLIIQLTFTSTDFHQQPNTSTNNLCGAPRMGRNCVEMALWILAKTVIPALMISAVTFRVESLHETFDFPVKLRENVLVFATKGSAWIGGGNALPWIKSILMQILWSFKDLSSLVLRILRPICSTLIVNSHAKDGASMDRPTQQHAWI